MSKVSFAGTAANFNDGDIMELRIKSSATNKTARLFKAGLWLKLKYLKKAEVFQRLSNRSAITATTNIPDGRLYWDAVGWTNPTVFFQTFAIATTSNIALMDHGINDSGVTSPTTVAGSTITPAATYTSQRTAALTLNVQNRFWVKYNFVSGTPIMGGAFLVIRATE